METTSTYKHTQIGYLTVAVTLPIVAMLIFLLALMWELSKGWSYFTIGLLLLFVFLGLAFSALTVQVTERELLFYFGPGFWKRHVSLDDIGSIEVVKNPILYGWGIRRTPEGWLYNVSGRWAVELEIQGEGSIRVGSDEPHALKQAIERLRQPSRVA